MPAWEERAGRRKSRWGRDQEALELGRLQEVPAPTSCRRRGPDVTLGAGHLQGPSAQAPQRGARRLITPGVRGHIKQMMVITGPPAAAGPQSMQTTDPGLKGAGGGSQRCALLRTPPHPWAFHRGGGRQARPEGAVPGPSGTGTGGGLEARSLRCPFPKKGSPVSSHSTR